MFARVHVCVCIHVIFSTVYTFLHIYIYYLSRFSLPLRAYFLSSNTFFLYKYLYIKYSLNSGQKAKRSDRSEAWCMRDVLHARKGHPSAKSQISRLSYIIVTHARLYIIALRFSPGSLYKRCYLEEKKKETEKVNLNTPLTYCRNTYRIRAVNMLLISTRCSSKFVATREET